MFNYIIQSAINFPNHSTHQIIETDIKHISKLHLSILEKISNIFLLIFCLWRINHSIKMLRCKQRNQSSLIDFSSATSQYTLFCEIAELKLWDHKLYLQLQNGRCINNWIGILLYYLISFSMDLILCFLLVFINISFWSDIWDLHIK